MLGYHDVDNMSDKEVNDLMTVATSAIGGIGGIVKKGQSGKGSAANVTNNAGKGSPIPVVQPTVAANGLTYQSNPKHTINPPPKAGIEPKNSLELFGNSVSISAKNQKARYTMDSDGNVHQFMPDNTGNWHWAGSTADKRNPLKLPNDVKSVLRKQEGWKIK